MKLVLKFLMLIVLYITILLGTYILFSSGQENEDSGSAAYNEMSRNPLLNN